MRTHFKKPVGLLAAITIIIFTCTIAEAFPADDITAQECLNFKTQVTCICLKNHTTGQARMICPEAGRNCWEDTGWITDVQPEGGQLPVYYDTQGDLYVIVGPNLGGTFGTSTGTCLPFTSNGSNTIMFPASIL